MIRSTSNSGNRSMHSRMKSAFRWNYRKGFTPVHPEGTRAFIPKGSQQLAGGRGAHPRLTSHRAKPDPNGVAAPLLLRPRWGRQCAIVPSSGGVASLNHRLIAEIPSG